MSIISDQDNYDTPICENAPVMCDLQCLELGFCPFAAIIDTNGVP